MQLCFFILFAYSLSKPTSDGRATHNLTFMRPWTSARRLQNPTKRTHSRHLNHGETLKTGPTPVRRRYELNGRRLAHEVSIHCKHRSCTNSLGIRITRKGNTHAKQEASCACGPNSPFPFPSFASAYWVMCLSVHSSCVNYKVGIRAHAYRGAKILNPLTYHNSTRLEENGF